MDKIFKAIAFLWFFIYGALAGGMIWGAAEKHEVGRFMSYLVFQWLIALSLYFVGDFIRRVSNAEDRLDSIIKKRRNNK